MPLTVSVVERSVFGRMKVSVADCTFDSSYPTGGEELLPATLGMSAVLACLVEEDADGYVVKYDRSNNKLMVREGPTADADGLITAPSLAIGTGSAAKVKYSGFNYRIDGVEAFKAGDEVAFTATTHDIADPDTDPREAIYVLSIAAGGTVTITKGADAAADAAVAPATPANQVKMGEVKVQHDGSAIFDASTDLLSAAHLTDTYTDATPSTSGGVLGQVASSTNLSAVVVRVVALGV